jgi:hypothetical protein
MEVARTGELQVSQYPARPHPDCQLSIQPCPGQWHMQNRRHAECGRYPEVHSDYRDRLLDHQHPCPRKISGRVRCCLVNKASHTDLLASTLCPWSLSEPGTHHQPLRLCHLVGHASAHVHQAEKAKRKLKGRPKHLLSPWSILVE